MKDDKIFWNVPLQVVIGGGICLVLSFAIGGWGICGPNETGLWLFLAALVAVPVGLLSWLILIVSRRMSPTHRTGSSRQRPRGFEMISVTSQEVPTDDSNPVLETPR